MTTTGSHLYPYWCREMTRSLMGTVPLSEREDPKQRWSCGTQMVLWDTVPGAGAAANSVSPCLAHREPTWAPHDVR